MNPAGYDIDEVFELQTYFENLGFDPTDATLKCEEVLKQFWYQKYLAYCCCPLRAGAAHFVSLLKQNGHKVILVSSRKKTGDNDFVGFIARMLTRIQMKINGLTFHEIHFFKDDEKKRRFILDIRPGCIIDDKPEILEYFRHITHTIGIRTAYNTCVNSEGLEWIDNFLQTVSIPPAKCRRKKLQARGFT